MGKSNNKQYKLNFVIIIIFLNQQIMISQSSFISSLDYLRKKDIKEVEYLKLAIENGDTIVIKNCAERMLFDVTRNAENFHDLINVSDMPIEFIRKNKENAIEYIKKYIVDLSTGRDKISQHWRFYSYYLKYKASEYNSDLWFDDFYRIKVLDSIKNCLIDDKEFIDIFNFESSAFNSKLELDINAILYWKSMEIDEVYQKDEGFLTTTVFKYINLNNILNEKLLSCLKYISTKDIDNEIINKIIKNELQLIIRVELVY
jgi:hypothetical protein